MRSSRLLFLAAFLGATGVMLGAFGAHALKERLVANATTSAWDTAVLYQLVHALAVLVVGACHSGSSGLSERWIYRAGVSWTVGVLLFSGSLYALALEGPRWLGPITPLGGLAMIAGWIMVMVAGRTPRPPHQP